MLSNIYFSAVDHMLEAKKVAFIRFGDDFVVFTKFQKQAKQIFSDIDGFIQDKLFQERNEDKSGVFQLGRCQLSSSRGISEIKRDFGQRKWRNNGIARPPDGGFDFLGFFFDLEGMRIREETMIKIASKIAMLTQRYKTGPLWYSDDGEEDKMVTVEEIKKVIRKVNLRFGYHQVIACEDGRVPFMFQGKGWVDSQACCGVTPEMIEQFKSLNRYLYHRMFMFSRPCVLEQKDGFRIGNTSFNDLKSLGLRSFLAALKDFRRARKEPHAN